MLYCIMRKQVGVRELISGAFFMPNFKKGEVPNEHHDYRRLQDRFPATHQIPRQQYRIHSTGTKSTIHNEQIERNDVTMMI